MSVTIGSIVFAGQVFTYLFIFRIVFVGQVIYLFIYFANNNDLLQIILFQEC